MNKISLGNVASIIKRLANKATTTIKRLANKATTTIKRLANKAITTIKRVAAKRSVRSICTLLLVAQCVLLMPLTLVSRFSPMHTGLLVLSICVIIDMIPDAFIDNNGGNDETKEGPDSK